MTREQLISLMQDVLAGPDADTSDYLVAYDDAGKLLAAIEAAGLCIAPREATEAMVESGHALDPLGCDIEPNEAQMIYAKIYRAMIDAGKL